MRLSLDAITIQQGSMRDYRALAGFHYRSARPATCPRVLAARIDRPTVVGRYLQRGASSQTLGVLVESLPPIHCRLRDVATGGRYRDLSPPRARLLALIHELRTISRVVVHPQWRGVGLSVRLVRHALSTATTRYTEALAAMGHVHPFFERAGMTAYRRPPHDFDARLRDALATAGLDLLDLVQLDAALARIDASPRRDLVRAELRRWHRQLQRQAAGADLPDLLRAARQRLITQPVYYLHRNAKMD